MGKKKRFRPKSAANDGNDVSKGDSDSNGSDDEIDYFHNKNDNQLLNRSALSQDIESDDDDYGSDEEIMPFDDDSSDGDDQDDGLNRFGIELKKDEMASDLEDSEEEQMDSKAWGNQRNAFYDTDYVDKDFKKYNQKDSHLADMEEEEALAIQRRLLESINESDVGIELLVGDIEPKTDFNDRKSAEDRDGDEERLPTNLSNLTKREKLEILRKESPEMETLINDFETYLTEMRDRLLPVMQAIKQRNGVNLMALKYIETRFHIIINYCVNICFYMSLKSNRIPVKEHPVLKQLVSFKKLLLEISSIASTNGSIDRDIDLVLEKLKANQKINFITEDKKRTKKQKAVENKKKVKFSDDLDVNGVPAPEDQAVGVDAEEGVEELAKRGITYEMAKNKGLTPKRKKELKNPRVKHRMKFRKAKIRRKGQVREPRKELHRYGGELSGIKARVVKSVKFR